MYLLDTNICVFFLRGRKEIVDKILMVGMSGCFISEITIAELLYGLECVKATEEERQKVKKFCESINVLPITEILEEYAKEKAVLRREGRLIDDLDLLIGATSKYYGVTLVTDNTKHFDRMGIKLENWVIR